MERDPEQRRQLEEAGQRVSRGLVLTLILGALVVLGLVLWFLRMGGSVWG